MKENIVKITTSDRDLRLRIQQSDYVRWIIGKSSLLSWAQDRKMREFIREYIYLIYIIYIISDWRMSDGCIIMKSWVPEFDPQCP